MIAPPFLFTTRYPDPPTCHPGTGGIELSVLMKAASKGPQSRSHGHDAAARHSSRGGGAPRAPLGAGRTLGSRARGAPRSSPGVPGTWHGDPCARSARPRASLPAAGCLPRGPLKGAGAAPRPTPAKSPRSLCPTARPIGGERRPGVGGRRPDRASSSGPFEIAGDSTPPRRAKGAPRE